MALSDGVIVEKQSPAPIEKERTRFIQWRTPGPQQRCAYLAALVPRAKGATIASPTFHVIEATGGWAVEVSDGAAIDLAMFRSERAPSVSAGGADTTGTAALLRKRANLPPTLYVLGRKGGNLY